VPVAATRGDDTALTIAVNLSGPAEARPGPVRPPPPIAPAARLDAYAQRIRSFAASLPLPRGARGGGGVSEQAAAQNHRAMGLLDVAFVSLQAMSDTLTRIKLADCAPDVTIEVPRNACGFHEFWRAREMIEVGRERAEQALAGAAATQSGTLLALDPALDHPTQEETRP
jgi:NTE family protein